MTRWTKIKSEPGVQSWETPLHPESVPQIKSNDAEEMLRHANEQLELQQQYPGRERSYPHETK